MTAKDETPIEENEPNAEEIADALEKAEAGADPVEASDQDTEASAGGDADAADDLSDLEAEMAEISADPHFIKIPEKARLAQAQEAIPILKEHIETDDVVLDASAVEEISTPYILTIVSFISSRGDEMKKVGILNAPSVVIDAFSDLGLFPELMKMEFRT